MKVLRVLAAILVAAVCLAACGGSHHHKAAVHASCPGYVTQWGCSAHSATFGLPPKGLGISPQLGTTSGVTMYDSVNLATVPANPSAVAGYTGGSWPTWFDLPSRFPHAVRVPIGIFGNIPLYKSLVGRMACLDVEPGDAPPALAGPWARGELTLGVKPCIYANLSTMPAVKASLAGLRRSQYFLWDADWTGTSHIDLGYDATQYTDHAFNRNLDASLVSKAFLGINPSPPLPVCIHKRMTRFECNGRKEQIAKQTRAAASSQRAYKARGCNVLSQRVSWFSTQLRKHPKVKAQSRRSALKASRKVYQQRSCPVYAQRVRYFTTAAAKLKAES